MTRRTDTDLDLPTPNGQRPKPPTPSVSPSAPTPEPATPVWSPPRGSLAQPGRRDEQPSDMAVTTRLERMSVELTPPPLPPSPAAADAERWFEQVPTSPGAVIRRDPSVVGENHRVVAGTLRSSPPPMVGPRPWLLPVLMVATALAVGMVLGALLFGRRGAAPQCPPCAPATPTVVAPSVTPLPAPTPPKPRAARKP